MGSSCHLVPQRLQASTTLAIFLADLGFNYIKSQQLMPDPNMPTPFPPTDNYARFLLLCGGPVGGVGPFALHANFAGLLLTPCAPGLTARFDF